MPGPTFPIADEHQLWYEVNPRPSLSTSLNSGKPGDIVHAVLIDTFAFFPRSIARSV
jgi:hypothetical protein